MKPGNILVGGSDRLAKVADYGISRIADTSSTMTSKGTMVYISPEVSRGERYGFSADVFSFAITMYEVCFRVSSGMCTAAAPVCNLLTQHTHQRLPYTDRERGKGIKLAMDVANKGKRPPIPDTWTAAISSLISSCWLDNAGLRTGLGMIMCLISEILDGGQGGLITVSTMMRVPSAKDGPDLYLAPGDLWQRIKTQPKHISLGEVIGAGAFSTVSSRIQMERDQTI